MFWEGVDATHDYKIPVAYPAAKSLMETSEADPVSPFAVDDAILE